MHAFDYIKPKTVWEAVDLLDDDPDARPLAGGMTLIPTLKQRLAQPTVLVDLAGLEDLQIITEAPSSLTVGAMKRHVQVARSPSVNAVLPVLAAADAAAASLSPAGDLHASPETRRGLARTYLRRGIELAVARARNER